MPGTPLPWGTPAGWDGSREQGHSFQCFPPLSMGRRYGCSSGIITSSWATALIPPTYRTIEMDVARHLTYTTPLTARREASSQRIITSSLMRFLTFQARLFPPCTCVTIPKYLQVAPCMEVRTNSKGPLQRTRGNWMGVSLSEISGLRGSKLFTTCVSWILAPPPTSPKTPRSACKPLGRSRRRITSTPDSNRVVTSLPSSPQCTAFLVSRRRQHLKVLPAALQQSGRNT